MILSGAKSIRDVIAFPKTQKAVCLLTDAPNEVSALQLRELGIKLRARDKDKEKETDKEKSASCCRACSRIPTPCPLSCAAS